MKPCSRNRYSVARDWRVFDETGRSGLNPDNFFFSEGNLQNDHGLVGVTFPLEYRVDNACDAGNGVDAVMPPGVLAAAAGVLIFLSRNRDQQYGG